VIDAFADINDMTYIEENDKYTLRKNLAYINNIGNLK